MAERIRIVSSGGGLRTIGFFKSSENLSSATAVAEISKVFAQTEKTLVIDCCLSNGILHNQFDLEEAPGMLEFQVSGGPIEKFVQNSKISNLDIIACGSKVNALLTEASSEYITKILSWTKETYSLVIFVLPPIDGDPNSIVYGKDLGLKLLLIEKGVDRITEVERSIKKFAIANMTLNGSVLI